MTDKSGNVFNFDMELTYHATGFSSSLSLDECAPPTKSRTKFEVAILER